MPRCIFVIGYPWCGKTKYIEEFIKTNKNFVVIDDYTKEHASPTQLINIVRTGRNIIISDIGFCFESVLKEAKKTIKKEASAGFFKYDFECVYFEPNAEKCIANIKCSETQSEDLQKIKLLHSVYNPPENCLEIIVNEI